MALVHTIIATKARQVSECALLVQACFRHFAAVITLIASEQGTIRPLIRFRRLSHNQAARSRRPDRKNCPISEATLHRPRTRPVLRVDIPVARNPKNGHAQELLPETFETAELPAPLGGSRVLRKASPGSSPFRLSAILLDHGRSSAYCFCSLSGTRRSKSLHLFDFLIFLTSSADMLEELAFIS
jgi:hypothetical protein